jgi:hypothetical protein
MPRKTAMTPAEVKADFFLVKKLTIPVAEMEARHAAGEAMYLEESLFSDSGDGDYSALYLGTQNIAYMPGF